MSATVNKLLLAATLGLGSSLSICSAEEVIDEVYIVAENAVLDEPLPSRRRRQPGLPLIVKPSELPQPNPNANDDLRPRIAAPVHKMLGDEFLPIQDRWRLANAIGIKESFLDPYNRNLLKADRPLFDDWFLNVSVISDSTGEFRSIPTPVGPTSSRNSGSIDALGGKEQFTFVHNFIFGLVFYKGDTVFRPPDYEFRITPVVSYNYNSVKEDRVLHIDPDDGHTRSDAHIGMQELFLDVHLRNVSDRYDFDSIRFGIQPFSTDFRGFLFQDNQLGIRLFGTRDNNLWQYNLAWFRRLEKDTNSGLNDLNEDLRDDDVFIANLYKQDTFVKGYTSQVTAIYNRNRESRNDLFYDDNGFLVRPASIGFERGRDYDAYYLGYNGDGHFGRLNLTVSGYYLFGRESNSVFTNENTDINAFFFASEAGWDFDWMRVRLSGLYASGDDDPFDDKAEGYDAIVENPIFAGADTSFWVRQAVPLIGGGGVALSGRNSILNSLRSSKDQGQSNFTNPGTILVGMGADFDVLPELRIFANVNHLWFDKTQVLETARNQGRINDDIGWDVSLSAIYRPFMSQNIVFQFSGAVLIPGDGYEALFGDDLNYSVLGNLVFTY